MTSILKTLILNVCGKIDISEGHDASPKKTGFDWVDSSTLASDWVI